MYAADYPDRPFQPYATFAEQLRMPVSMLGSQRFWAARAQGRIVGTATAAFPERENRQLTITKVRVPPDLRRKGIGTALLRATLADMRSERRGTVTGQGLKVGGDGEKWASALGFRKVQDFVLQTLVVADIDSDLWEVPAPEGFGAERWSGAASESLVAGYARARTAITDAPRDKSSLKFPEWNVERVRKHEADARRRGCELRTVIAVDESSGTVAGLTQMELRPSRPDFGYQLDTAVLPQFRGRGLGRFIKAAMMRWLIADRPDIERVATNTDASNVHMIRVNHEIGYVTDNVVTDVEAHVDALDLAFARGIGSRRSGLLPPG